MKAHASGIRSQHESENAGWLGTRGPNECELLCNGLATDLKMCKPQIVERFKALPRYSVDERGYDGTLVLRRPTGFRG